MPLCPSAPLPLGPAPLPLFFMSFTAVLLLHVLYALLNDTPPVWDMAYHQMQGFQYLAAWKSGAWRQFADLSSYYPPLYYLQEAVILGLGSYNRFLPLLANLPGIFLLSFCTFHSSNSYPNRRWAWLAGLLTLLFPLVAWTSRESLLDVSLSGWVAAAVFVLWRSRRMLESHPWSLLLGVIFALGMLTKWTFPAFLVFPIGYALYASRDRKRSLLHLFDAVLIGTPAVFFWYLPNLKSLAERFALTSGTGTALENDPTALHLQGWLYYPRCLSSYYLYLPLTVLFVAGFILWLRGPGSDREGASLVWWWLGGSCLLLTLLDAKDPRYMMPLAAPVAILLVSFWRHRPAFLWAIVVVASLQFLLVSFNVLGRPVKLAVFDIRNDTDYMVSAGNGCSSRPIILMRPVPPTGKTGIWKSL